MDDRAAQLVDPLERGWHVVDGEVGKRASIAGPSAALVDAKPQAVLVGLPALPRSRPPRRQADPEQPAPEAQGTLGVVGGKLDQWRRHVIQPASVSRIGTKVGTTLPQRTRLDQVRGSRLAEVSTTSLRHPLTRALLVLTVTTGVIDAASYLGLGHVFTANMTGNIVFLGFGIAGGSGLPVISPLVSLAAFLVGAALGGRMAGALPVRTTHFSRSMLIEIGVVLLAAVLALVLDVAPNRFSGDLIIALLAFGMGVRNATVRRVKVADLTTTVLTMTLTGLAADSRLGGGDGEGSWRRTTAVMAMLVGAIAGALLLKVHLALVLGLAALLTILTWIFFVPAAIAADRTSE